jgi:hypothetical protein
LLDSLQVGETGMTRATWWLVGAIEFGLAIPMYLLFFCPVECR